MKSHIQVKNAKRQAEDEQEKMEEFICLPEPIMQV